MERALFMIDLVLMSEELGVFEWGSRIIYLESGGQ